MNKKERNNLDIWRYFHVFVFFFLFLMNTQFLLRSFPVVEQNTKHKSEHFRDLCFVFCHGSPVVVRQNTKPDFSILYFVTHQKKEKKTKTWKCLQISKLFRSFLFIYSYLYNCNFMSLEVSLFYFNFSYNSYFDIILTLIL